MSEPGVGWKPGEDAIPGEWSLWDAPTREERRDRPSALPGCSGATRRPAAGGGLLPGRHRRPDSAESTAPAGRPTGTRARRPRAAPRNPRRARRADRTGAGRTGVPHRARGDTSVTTAGGAARVRGSGRGKPAAIPAIRADDGHRGPSQRRRSHGSFLSRRAVESGNPVVGDDSRAFVMARDMSSNDQRDCGTSRPSGFARTWTIRPHRRRARGTPEAPDASHRGHGRGR